MTLTLWLWSLGCAHARERVVLFQTPDLRPGLCSVLRIQLADLADVACLPDPAGDDLAQRLSSGAVQTRAQEARLGVLLTRGERPGRVHLYLVGEKTDEALVSIAEANPDDPDLDRSLALKVRAALDVAISVSALTSAPDKSPEPVSALLRTRPPRRPRWEGLLGVAGGASLGTRRRFEGAMSIGLSKTYGVWSVEPRIAALFWSAVRVRGDDGRVDERAQAVGLRLHSVRRFNRLLLGGHLLSAVLRSEATALARDGRRGTRTSLLPLFGIGADMRVALLEWVWLCLRPRVDWLPVAQTYTTDDVKRLSLGRVRAALDASLLVRFPLERTR